MIYIPAILIMFGCFYVQHDPTPATVCGVVSGLIGIAMKALPGASTSQSPSGAVTFRQGPPSWAVSAWWFMLALWAGTCGYCGWWAAQ